MAIIDLRPKKGELVYEMLRLGLSFDSGDITGHQVWFSYTKQLRAECDIADTENIVLTDTVTRIQKVVTLEELTSASQILTWTSKNPLGNNTSSDNTDLTLE